MHVYVYIHIHTHSHVLICFVMRRKQSSALAGGPIVHDGLESVTRVDTTYMFEMSAIKSLTRTRSVYHLEKKLLPPGVHCPMSPS